MYKLNRNESIGSRCRYIGLFIIVLFCVACGTVANKDQSHGKMGSNTMGLNSLGEVDRALYDKALESLAQSDYKAALRDLKILLTRRQDVADVWVNYSLCLYHQNNTAELKAALASMTKHSIVTPQSLNLQGLLAVEDGQFQEASSYYNSALKMDPKYSNAWFNLALLNDIYLQNVAKAVEYYSQYMELQPQDDTTKIWLESLSLSLGASQ